MNDLTNRSMLDQWSATANDRAAIREFWDWLVERRGDERVMLGGTDVLDVRIEDALDKFHGIDRGQLDRERRMLLDPKTAADPRLSPTQQFAVWFMFKEERRLREIRRDPSAVFEMESNGTMPRGAMLALQSLGLVTARDGVVHEKKHRGGRGIIRAGYTKRRPALLWSLTDAGRELGPSVKHPGEEEASRWAAQENER